MALRSTDPHYLKNHQYRDASNLDVRVELHRRFSTNPVGWMLWVFDHLLKLPEEARILELGCGPGHLWKENIDRIPARWRITLSDLSPGMLDTAWRNLVVTGRTFRFQEVDAQSIPFEEEAFDAVIANHMLYHVPDRPRAIAEIRRVLKPGGRVFATTIGTSHLEEIAGWIRQVSSGDVPQSFGEPFSLENGFEQLQPFFSAITLARYPDSLRVTEVELVLAFMRSTTYAGEMSEEKVAGLRLDLERQLQETGAILIHKDSGLFEAIK